MDDKREMLKRKYHLSDSKLDEIFSAEKKESKEEVKKKEKK